MNGLFEAVKLIRVCRFVTIGSLFLASAANALGADPACGTSTSLSGRVIDVSSGSQLPVGGVPVHLIARDRKHTLQSVSGQTGEFSFVDLEPGHYLLTAAADGLTSSQVALDLGTGDAATVDLSVERFFTHELTVSATRTERRTAKVPASVTVVGKDVLRHTPMTNIQDALRDVPGTLVQSRNRGYDARLIIRGAGLKARYGIREIMVLQDGIPITDPDSLTRLDMVETHLVDSVEVVRGPNSTLWGLNATGGVVNIRTRSPFADAGGFARADVGSDGSRNLELSVGTGITERFRLLASLSRRQAGNAWRPWNEFSTTQLSLRPGLVLGDSTVWESTLSYSKADLQIPGRLVTDPRRGVDQWTPYLDQGWAEETADPWRHSGRYSEVGFLGSTLVHQMGAVELKPTLYLSRWRHHHPVTARINDADTLVGGLDLQVDWRYGAGALTGGVTVRADSRDGRAATYADTQTSPSGRVLATLSDEPGLPMRVLDQQSVLLGAYLQESLQPGPRWLLDVGLRWDRVRIQIAGHEAIDFNYASGRYVEGQGVIDCEFESTALSPRVGAVFRAGRAISLYASVSSGTQTPTVGELTENPELGLTRVISYEIGLKLRHPELTLDAAVFSSPLRGEIVQVVEPHGTTGYANAGRTDKTGFELAAAWRPLPGLTLGGSYAYSRFVFRDFSEPVFGRNLDRSGNRLPFVPRHQYSFFAAYEHRSGLHLRVSADTWGRYSLDNANSAEYGGYALATDLSLGYRLRRLEIGLIIQNLFDQRYAVEVQKDLYGTTRWSPAAPRRLLARCAYRF